MMIEELEFIKVFKDMSLDVIMESNHISCNMLVMINDFLVMIV